MQDLQTSQEGKETGPMNIPNVLTILRLLLVPVLVILLIQKSFTKAFVLFVVCGLTDALDGFIARLLNQKTVLGAYLDPIADKALMISCFITLSVRSIIPPWLSVIVISRDCIILLGISVLSLMRIPFEIRPLFVSKITTLLQIVTIMLVLLFQSKIVIFSTFWLKSLYWLTALFTILSGLIYIYRGVRYINEANGADRGKSVNSA